MEKFIEFRKAIASGKNSENYCMDFLSAAKTNKFRSSAVPKNYLEALLFAIGYAPTREIFENAKSELNRFEKTNLFGVNKLKLINSGLPNSVVQSSFSLTFVKNLLDAFPESVQFHSFGSSKEKQLEILAFVLPIAEREQLTKDNFSPVHWLKKNYANDKKLVLKNLVRLFSGLKCSLEIKEKLYAELLVFVEIQLTEITGSQFSEPLNFLPFYFHSEGIVKKINALEKIREKGLIKMTISDEQKHCLLRKARLHLATFLRETDPFTYANQKDVHLFDCGRGFSVLIMSTQVEKRQVFDSYLGYMAFKNGIPCAYGGAWLFGSNAKIGLNIFPAFRGGESAMIFCQLMRLYSLEFGVARFTIEPYQIGKGNPEAILSAAFWFYFKLGFRSVDKNINKVSVREFALLKRGKLKFSRPTLLKSFAAAEMEFVLPNYDGNYFDSVAVAEWISSKINEQYNGDRVEAIQQIRFHWLPKIGKLIGENELPHLLNLLLFYVYLPSVLKGNKRRTSEVIQLVVKKITDQETDYVRQLNSLKWLKKEVALLLKKE